MSLVMQATQQALISKLTGDAVLMDRVDAVYDTVPQRSALPYANIADLSQEAIPALGEQAWQVRLAIEVWTEGHSRKVALDALERMHALLHNGALSVSGYSVSEMRVESASCLQTDQGARIVGAIEIAIILAT